MRVDEVGSRAELREFIELPLRLHPRELAVPLLAATVETWWRGTGPHPEPVRLLLVRDDAGRVVGRSTVHTDARLDARLGERSLLFGATEFADEPAARALFAELDRRADGRRQLFGPVSLLPNQAGGVVTSGFAERGFVDSAWNPGWVPGTYEALGFERWGESDTWLVEVPTSTTAAAGSAGEPSAPAAPTAAEWEQAGLRLDRARRSQMNRLVPEVREVLNRSFAQLPYYTPITPAEMAAATDGLAFLVDEDLVLLARDAGSGAIVAFVLVVPDITSFLQRCGGRMGPLRQLQLLATRRRYRTEAILVIQGTDPSRQGQGVLSLLSRQLQANLAARGYRRLRSTWVGRDNPGSSRQFERYGGRPLHGCTFYRRSVAPADVPARPPQAGPSRTGPS